MDEQVDAFLPPSEPPPFLSLDQLTDLACHGWLRLPLSDSTMQNIVELFEEMSSFFDKSSRAKCDMYPSKSGTEFGFYQVVDEKEYLTIRCEHHPELELEKKASRIWRDAATLLHRVLCDIARATDSPYSMWDSLLDGTLTLPEDQTSMTASLLRLFRYYPGSGVAEKHTDLGLLTLCIGGGKGLQVMDKTQEEPIWIDAEGPTILVGRTLQALSNGLIQPGIHRVVENADGRHSIVFALRHSWRHPIDLQPFGAEGTIDSRLLWEIIKDGIVNINAKKDIRQRQRADAAAKRQAAEVDGQG